MYSDDDLLFINIKGIIIKNSELIALGSNNLGITIDLSEVLNITNSQFSAWIIIIESISNVEFDV